MYHILCAVFQVTVKSRCKIDWDDQKVIFNICTLPHSLDMIIIFNRLRTYILYWNYKRREEQLISQPQTYKVENARQPKISPTASKMTGSQNYLRVTGSAGMPASLGRAFPPQSKSWCVSIAIVDVGSEPLDNQRHLRCGRKTQNSWKRAFDRVTLHGVHAQCNDGSRS